MPTLLDPITARLSAILGGTYPASPATPYVPPSTFTPGVVFLPHQNPEWPGGTARAAANRRWDLVWRAATWDARGYEGSAGGPWVRRLAFALRVQYEIVRPAALAPRDRALVLGALAVASSRAMSDLLEVQRIFMIDDAWAGAAMAYVPSPDAIAVDQRDSVTLVGTLRGAFLVEQSAMTAGTLWTP